MQSFGRTLARLTVLACVRAGAVLAGCAVAATVCGAAWGAQDVMLAMAQPDSALTIEGSISGVVAGAAGAPLVLTLHNGNDVVKDVVHVTAQSTGVVDGPAGCERGHYLDMGEWNGAVSVPAHGTATVTVPVAVSASLPSECVGVTWGLAYTAY